MTSTDFIAINALSDGASQTSAAIPADQIEYVSAIAIFADADAVGSVKLQANNDIDLSSGTMSFTPSSAGWADIPSSSQSVTAGATIMIPATLIAYNFIRVVYTRVSGGTTTVTVKVFYRSKK